jgi:DNA-binding MarR family transcriptional regulator
MNQGKERPEPRRPHGTFHLLMHIGHLLEERCRAGLAEYGLHHGQARVLMALDGGDRGEGGIIQARLAAGMDIATPTLSVMLKKLAACGLVRRTADADDERVHRISLTADGRKALKKVRMVWDAAEKSIVGSFDQADAEKLHQILLGIRNVLGGKTPEL